MRLVPLLLVCVLPLAGCASVSPEAKVRAKLIDAGISPPIAGCMAERLVDRLSISQLKRLQSLAKLPDRDIGGMTIDQFLHHLRALDDPEIFAVVSKAGIGCAIAA